MAESMAQWDENRTKDTIKLEEGLEHAWRAKQRQNYNL